LQIIIYTYVVHYVAGVLWYPHAYIYIYHESY
jgi:hypothetical protein